MNLITGRKRLKHTMLSALGLAAVVLMLSSCITTPKAGISVREYIAKTDIVGHWEGVWGSMYL